MRKLTAWYHAQSPTVRMVIVLATVAVVFAMTFAGKYPGGGKR